MFFIPLMLLFPACIILFVYSPKARVLVPFVLLFTGVVGELSVPKGISYEAHAGYAILYGSCFLLGVVTSFVAIFMWAIKTLLRRRKANRVSGSD